MEEQDDRTIAAEHVEVDSPVAVSAGQLVVYSEKSIAVHSEPRESIVPSIAQSSRKTLKTRLRAAVAVGTVLATMAAGVVVDTVSSPKFLVSVGSHFAISSILLLGVGPFQQPQAASGYTGPGDVVASAKAWYGLRAYNAAARGNKVANVCIPLDATCADLSSDPTTGALVITNIGGSSCSVVTCTVKTLYDQSGALACSGGTACDVTQATIGSRPTLVVSCVSSLPCMTFAGAGELDHATNFIALSQPYTISYSAKNTTAASGAIFANSTNAASVIAYMVASGAPSFYAGGSATSSSVTGLNTWYAVQNIYSDALSASSLYVNGTSTTGSPGTNAIDGTMKGVLGVDSFGNHLTGSFVEVGIWSGAFNSTQYAAMNSNQRTYWGF